MCTCLLLVGDQLGRRHVVQTWAFAEEYREGERQKGYREMMMDHRAEVMKTGGGSKLVVLRQSSNVGWVGRHS